MMSSRSLSKILNVDPSVITRYEESEVNETISIATLNKIANALNCEVKYCLIPKTSLQEILWDQAKKVLKNEDNKLNHTMSLENQKVTENLSIKEDLRIAMLLHEKAGKIWNE